MGLTGLKSKAAFFLGALGENPFLTFSSFQRLYAFLDSRPHHSDLLPSVHLLLSV